MSIDYLVMLLIVIGTILSLFIFVKKEDVRKAFLAFATAQIFTWPIGIILTGFGAVEYPVRLFPKAVDSSFLHGYIMNPVIFAIYYIHYPKKKKLIWKWIYAFLFPMIPILIEFYERKYTNLIIYKHWNVFILWLIIVTLNYIARRYLDWFFKNAPKRRLA